MRSENLKFEGNKDLSLNYIIMTEEKAVCRTCLCATDLQPLFTSEEGVANLQEALYLSTGLKIQSDDGLPQDMCKKCLKMVEKTIKFRKKSQAADHTLRKNCIYKANMYTSSHIKIFPQGRSVMTNNKGEVAFKQKLKKVQKECSTEIEMKSLNGNCELEQCLESEADRMTSDDGIVDPPSPKTEITSNITLKATESSDNFDRKRYLDLIEGPVDTKKPIQCKICKKISKSFNRFQKHAMSHLGYNILCEFCAKSCISNTSLLRHQRAKHGLARDNSFPCSFCGYQAIDKEQLEVHERRIHTKERPFVCDNCGAGFFSKRVLLQHLVNHKPDKPFQCNACPSKFKLRCHLTNHMKRVHKKYMSKYTYGCHICLKKYSSTGDVRKHLVKIHGVPVQQQGKVQRFYFQPPESRVCFDRPSENKN